MSVVCEGIEMYDPRLTLKREAAEDIEIGECVYIHTDGLAYLCDNGKSDVCHGIALKDTDSGDQVTILTAARIRVDTAQTIGARAYSGNQAGGTAPSTTLAANGVVCGWAFESRRVWFQAPTPAADG